MKARMMANFVQTPSPKGTIKNQHQAQHTRHFLNSRLQYLEFKVTVAVDVLRAVGINRPSCRCAV